MVILRDDSEQHRGSNNPYYGIGDLAREFDTTLRAIRHYEAQGLITPLRNGQVRVYGERDRVRLKLILRDAGSDFPSQRSAICSRFTTRRMESSARFSSC